MPSLEAFDPTPAVNWWLDKKTRKPKSSLMAKQQKYFNGVFDAADKKNERK
jgi:hypothetical protein